MADVGFTPVRGNTNEIANTPLEDGQFLFTTESGNGNKVYVDVLRDDGTVERIGIMGNYLDKNGDTFEGDLEVDGDINVNGDITFTSSTGLNVSLKNIFKAVYPVGSIYMSVNNTNPSSLFGGSWVAWGSGRVPVGVNSSDTDFDSVEETGGAKSHTYTPSGTNSGGAVQPHTLTISEMPSHSHVYYHANYDWAHGGGTSFATEGLINERTDEVGGNQPHSHGFTQPTFSGTQSTFSHLQPYITCYMWKRVL